jgi:hypothetical protein
MAKLSFGNHSSVLVLRQDRDSIRKFYCDVLGGKIMKADPERDFVRLGEDFYIAFLYHPGYYATWVLDPDGHDIEVVNKS